MFFYPEKVELQINILILACHIFQVTGTVMNGKVRIQTNLLIAPIIFPQNHVYFNVTPTMVPLMWSEEVCRIKHAYI